MKNLRICFCLAFIQIRLFTSSLSLPSRKLPPDELARRRKSPSLWRDDLGVSPDETTNQVSSKRRLYHPPEVMAPVGGWPQLRAAVANGADAVYLGLTSFSARARAVNFDPHEELHEAVNFCRKYNVKVYVALNTLVFQSEMTELVDLIRACQKADAVIVQDVGLARLIQRVAPSLEIHASTQQTVTSSDGVDFCQKRIGATRVVVGRELSVKEISDVASQTTTEIEAFVHGALCVSYSGQCFSSEAWGGRSANRGQCAQACRLPYGLIVDGELRDLQDMAYLLSPQDLCGIDHVKELIEAGVACLKIEGRLKDANYVAATTRAYRNAVDKAWGELAQQGKVGEHMTKLTRRVEQGVQISKAELAQLFSRGQDDIYDGLTSGFFDGSRHQVLVRGRSPRHRGVNVGRVLDGSSYRNGLQIELTGQFQLKQGDGLVVDRGMAQDDELGGPIFDLSVSNNIATVRFGKEVERRWKRSDDDAVKGIGYLLAPPGAYVWRTKDEQVDKKIRRLAELEPSAPIRGLVKISVAGSAGNPLIITLTMGEHKSTAYSDQMMEKANSIGLGHGRVSAAIGSLGNTDWEIDGEIDLTQFDDGAWCPISVVKETRRRAVEQLRTSIEIKDSKLDRSSADIEINNSSLDGKAMISKFMKELESSVPSLVDSATRLTVLARSIEQVDAICDIIKGGEDGISEIIIDFLEVGGMQDAVNEIRAVATNVKITIASPRVLKPGEAGIWRTLLRLEPDGLLVRSSGLLYRLTELGGAGARVNVRTREGGDCWVRIPELFGDFSLNVANPLTAYEYLNSGLSRITTSYDLSANSITDLAHMMEKNAARLEVVVHAKIPIFHTEHCVFARFLSKGNSYLDCGHVCTRHNVHLRDEKGFDNLVLADMGCRNTVFAAQSQSGAHTISKWKKAGVGYLRIELVDEDPKDIPMIIQGYLGVLRGTMKPSTLWDVLDSVRDINGRVSGVSLGSLRNQAERRAGAVE